MSKGSSRRELMRPVQLLAFAFACALFAGIVTAVTGGLFQDGVGARALPLAGIVAGIAFIVVLLGLSLLLLAVDPHEITATVDRPVLLDPAPDLDADGVDAQTTDAANRPNPAPDADDLGPR